MADYVELAGIEIHLRFRGRQKVLGGVERV